MVSFIFKAEMEETSAQLLASQDFYLELNRLGTPLL